MDIVTEFDIERLISWVPGEKAAFGGAEKAASWGVRMVDEDTSWTRVFDDGGEDELIIKALAQSLDAVIMFLR